MYTCGCLEHHKSTCFANMYKNFSLTTTRNKSGNMYKKVLIDNDNNNKRNCRFEFLSTKGHRVLLAFHPQSQESWIYALVVPGCLTRVGNWATFSFIIIWIFDNQLSFVFIWIPAVHLIKRLYKKSERYSNWNEDEVNRYWIFAIC